MSRLVLVTVMFVALAGVMSAQTPVELKVGDKAPDFSLPGTDGKTHKLSELKGKHVVLAWYPRAGTPGCTAECKSFHDSSAGIRAFNVAYFMASVDTLESNKEFAKVTGAEFPLLSDPEKTVATAYGVLNARGTANRWTFYIGPDGTIQYIEKQVTPNTAGQDVIAKLTELKARKL